MKKFITSIGAFTLATSLALGTQAGGGAAGGAGGLEWAGAGTGARRWRMQVPEHRR